MIILDDADIFDDVSASRLNPVKEKPDFRRLQWLRLFLVYRLGYPSPPLIPRPIHRSPNPRISQVDPVVQTDL